ncbi:MAG TPA: hypothetical protein VJ955_08870 [Desulfuromonadales bacterium]|nr:hypothetical protein [Desulfuromonadales bacterium]
MELRPEAYEATLQALDDLKEYTLRAERKRAFICAAAHGSFWRMAKKPKPGFNYWNGTLPASEKLPNGDFLCR